MAKEFKLKNPDAPMSFKQGIMIRNNGGGDVREEGLTMQEASDRIAWLMRQKFAEGGNETGKEAREDYKNLQFKKVWEEAVKAGREAGDDVNPIPMVISGGYDPVMDGACGFAWVNIKPGNSAFANWLKKNEHARKDTYYGGVTVWISEYNQSMTRKEAHASAMAKVFQAHGFNASAASRMD